MSQSTQRTTKQRLLTNLTLDQLYAFQTMVRSGSIRRAATELNLSQPALSQRIKHLESILGAPIIQRHRGAPFTLTSVGRMLQRFSEGMLRDIGAFHSDLEATKEPPTEGHDLKILTTSDYMVNFTLGVLGIMRQQGVKFRVSFLQAPNMPDLIARLDNNEAEVAICRAPVPDGLWQIRLLQERLYLVVPPMHRILSVPVEDRLEVLASEQFAIFHRNSRSRAHVERWAEKVGINLNIAIESRSIEPMKIGTMHGLVVSILPSHTVALELQAGQLSIADVPGLPLTREAAVVTRAGHALSYVARSFIEDMDAASSELEIDVKD